MQGAEPSCIVRVGLIALVLLHERRRAVRRDASRRFLRFGQRRLQHPPLLPVSTVVGSLWQLPRRSPLRRCCIIQGGRRSCRMGFASARPLLHRHRAGRGDTDDSSHCFGAAVSQPRACCDCFCRCILHRRYSCCCCCFISPSRILLLYWTLFSCSIPPHFHHCPCTAF